MVPTILTSMKAYNSYEKQISLIPQKREEENNTLSGEDCLIAEVIATEDKVKGEILEFSPFKSPGVHSSFTW